MTNAEEKLIEIIKRAANEEPFSIKKMVNLPSFEKVELDGIELKNSVTSAEIDGKNDLINLITKAIIKAFPQIIKPEVVIHSAFDYQGNPIRVEKIYEGMAYCLNVEHTPKKSDWYSSTVWSKLKDENVELFIRIKE